MVLIMMMKCNDGQFLVVIVDHHWIVPSSGSSKFDHLTILYNAIALIDVQGGDGHYIIIILTIIQSYHHQDHHNLIISPPSGSS